MSNDPFSLDEISAILEIYQALHGPTVGLCRFRFWLDGKHLTEEAYAFLAEVYKEKKR